MSNEIDIEELERYATRPDQNAFLKKTNQDVKEWMKGFYTNGPDNDFQLHCLWAWQENERRHIEVIKGLIDRMKKAEAELERERMRLAACGVVALADTPESSAKAREMRDEYRSASCDDVARRVDECMTLRAERDALAAKLAEPEGQEPVFWYRPCSDGETYDDPIHNAHIERVRRLSGAWVPLFARPVPAEPVNTRLLDALKRAKDSLVAFKFVPGGANCWEASDEENLTAVNSAIAAAEAQQERLLQDMHDAGREIDRVMAEPAQKVPQIDLDAIARAIWNVRREEEDRCDMELEDVRRDHSVWEEASEVASILKDAGIEVAE